MYDRGNRTSEVRSRTGPRERERDREQGGRMEYY